MSAVLAHWATLGGLSSQAANAIGVELSEGRAFLITKAGNEWHLHHTTTGERPPYDGQPTKALARAHAAALETMLVDGRLFDWHAPDAPTTAHRNADARAACERAADEGIDKAVIANQDYREHLAPPTRAGTRFTTTAQLRRHFHRGGDVTRLPHTADDTPLPRLANDPSLTITTSGQIAVHKILDTYVLTTTATGHSFGRDTGPAVFTARNDAHDFADRLADLTGEDGTRIDWSRPSTYEDLNTWRSADGHELDWTLTLKRAEFDRERGSPRPTATPLPEPRPWTKRYADKSPSAKRRFPPPTPPAPTPTRHPTSTTPAPPITSPRETTSTPRITTARRPAPAHQFVACRRTGQRVQPGTAERAQVQDDAQGLISVVPHIERPRSAGPTARPVARQRVRP